MAVIGDRSDIEEALAAVQTFGAGAALTARIAGLETRLQGKTRDKAAALLTADHIDETALSGALTIYLLDKQHALRFLGNRRAIASVLSKNASVQARFRVAHQDEFATVREYWATVEDRVEIIDLRDLVPAFKGAVSERETSAVPRGPAK